MPTLDLRATGGTLRLARNGGTSTVRSFLAVGPQGVAGPAGPTGPASTVPGPIGSTGPQGPPGVNAFTEDPAISSTTYADVTLDANGRVSRATKTNGYNYFPLAEAVKAIIAGVTSTADQFGPYVSGTIDAAGKYAENVIGPNGRVPGWVLAAWLSRFDADTFAAKQGLFLPRTGYGAARTREGTLRRELSKLSVIECRGDSLTFGFGDNTQTGGWPTRLQTAIPAATVNNRGVSGMTSTELAIYDGAVIPIITVAGNSIPVGGTANVTLVAPTSSFQFNNGGGGTTVWTGTLGVGGPAATLNHNVAATSQTAGWTVTLTTPGAVTPVAPETPFIVASGAALGYDRDSLYLLADGRNNPVRADFLRDAVARINQLTPLRPRFLVFSILTASNETAGSAPYVDIVSTNQAAAALFGTNYLDVRRYIIDNAAAKIVAMGGTVSATDRQCIDNDTIPPSLHNPDNLHLNGWGYDLYETCVFAALTTKGWVAS